MGGNRVLIRCKRSKATREKLAQRARERQGVNGRWESNKDKAAARAAKRGCCRLGTLFAGLAFRKKRAEEKALTGARQLLSKLAAATSDAAFVAVLGDLQGLSISAKLMRRTLLPRKVAEAAKRFPKAKAKAKKVLDAWRAKFREDTAKEREAREAPSQTVAKAAGAAPSSVAAAAPATMAAAPARGCGSAPAPLPLAPTPTKERRRSASVSSSSSSSSSSASSEELPTPEAGRLRQQRQQQQQQATQALSAATPPGKSSRLAKQSRITAFMKLGGEGKP